MMKLYQYDSEDYKMAFQTVLNCLVKDEAATWLMLDSIIKNLLHADVAADWGAGLGNNTAKLCQRFKTVYSIEPNVLMREEIAKTCPDADLLAGTIANTRLPRSVDFGIISHVLYHIPDHEWAGQILHCAEQLSPGGILWVLMKHPDTGCNEMLEAFGAPRFNLFNILKASSKQLKYTIKFQALPGRIKTSTLEDTLTIARFMLSDRSQESFTNLPGEAAFIQYVKQHLWDEAQQSGGWEFNEITATIGRNPLF